MCFVSGFSQIMSFNESTTLLNKPHGKPIFQINAGVESWVIEPEYADVWREIEVSCYIEKKNIYDSFILTGTILYDYRGDSIGVILNKTLCDTSRSPFLTEYQRSIGQTQIVLTGFIEEEKLVNISRENTQNQNRRLEDSCICKVFSFKTNSGESLIIREDCREYITQLKHGCENENVLVKELKKTTTYFAAASDYTSMIVQITRDYDTDHPQTFVISNDAYKCSIDKNLILFSEYNWSAGPQEEYQYSVSTFKQIMNFHGKLRSVNIPKSNIAGFIGYLPKPDYHDSLYSGVLTLTSPEEVLIKKTIVCNNKELDSQLTYFDARMKFVMKNELDKVSVLDSTTLILNSKSGCASKDCLTDFGLILYLGYEGEAISIELEFRDGDVFLVNNYQDAFELR